MNLLIVVLIILLIIILYQLFRFKKKEGFQLVIYGKNMNLLQLPEIPILYIPSNRQLYLYKQLPKIIFTFWDTGWNKAPYVCQKCIYSWSFYNPEYKIIKLDKKNVYKYLDSNFLDKLWKKNQIQTQSDILRLNLLNKYGGIWVDSTLLCTQPLYHWLPCYLDIGFFTLSYHSRVKKGIIVPDEYKLNNCFSRKYKISSISSFFIVSNKDNYILNTFTKEYNLFWKDRYISYNYFNFHSVFNRLYKKNFKFKKILDKMPIFDSRLVVLTDDYVDNLEFDLSKPPTKNRLRIINNKNIPLLKLSHQYTVRRYFNGSSTYMHEKKRHKLEIDSFKKGTLLSLILDNLN